MSLCRILFNLNASDLNRKNSTIFNQESIFFKPFLRLIQNDDSKDVENFFGNFGILRLDLEHAHTPKYLKFLPYGALLI